MHPENFAYKTLIYFAKSSELLLASEKSIIQGWS